MFDAPLSHYVGEGLGVRANSHARAATAARSHDFAKRQELTCGQNQKRRDQAEPEIRSPLALMNSTERVRVSGFARSTV